jgi:hypothetical protein
MQRSSRAINLRLAWSMLVLLGLSFASLPCAVAEPHNPYAVKAACLYNFIKFVEWPERAFPEGSSNLTIGVLGDNPFGSTLGALNGKVVKGRSLVVRQVSSVREAQNCQMVFISTSERARLPQVLDGLQTASVLTVSEMSGFVKNGGMINFTEQGNNLAFEINQAAAVRARLTISSQLLKLAKNVIRS